MRPTKSGRIDDAADPASAECDALAERPLEAHQEREGPSRHREPGQRIDEN